MGDDLVAVKIKVDPVRTGAAFGAAEQLAIEGAGGGEVMNGEGEMEWRHGGKLARTSHRVNRIDPWEISLNFLETGGAGTVS